MNLHKKNISLLAVCCELRENLENHNLLKNCEKVGEFLSNPEYYLVEDIIYKNLPAELINGYNSLIFEVYKVNTSILEEISDLKTFYFANCVSNENDKKLINTPFGKAIIYLSNLKINDSYNIITDCDYADYVNYKKLIK